MIASFKVMLETYNEEDGMSHEQVARALEQVVEKVRRGFTAGNVKDENGNVIGEFFWSMPNENDDDIDEDDE